MRRVTVEEICCEAGVSKMTFYRLFSNKEAVAEVILFEIMEKGMSQYRSIMRQDIPYAQKVEQMIAMKQNSTHEISKEFVKDIFQNRNPTLKKHLDDFSQKVRKKYIKDFKVAQKKGWIRKEIKPEFILYILDDLQAKMMDDRLLRMFKNGREITTELTNFFSHGILTKK